MLSAYSQKLFCLFVKIEFTRIYLKKKKLEKCHLHSVIMVGLGCFSAVINVKKHLLYLTKKNDINIVSRQITNFQKKPCKRPNFTHRSCKKYTTSELLLSYLQIKHDKELCDLKEIISPCGRISFYCVSFTVSETRRNFNFFSYKQTLKSVQHLLHNPNTMCPLRVSYPAHQAQ